MEYQENKLRILVAEDNELIIEGLEYVLKKEGFDVKIVNTKDQTLSCVKNEKFDLILLDVQLPDGTGFDICKHIKNTIDIPIIFMSARGEEANIVYGLDIGADDYIVKPFRNNELISRINSVLRRYRREKNRNKMLEYKNIKVDIEKAKVFKNSKEIILTSLEYKILLMFLSNPNTIITREELLEKIWDIDGNYVNDNTLSVYIKRLRLKISDDGAGEDEMIKTIRGIGYILNKISD